MDEIEKIKTVKRMADALETIAAVMTKIREEGITIYTHEDGPETRN